MKSINSFLSVLQHRDYRQMQDGRLFLPLQSQQSKH